MVPVSLPPSDPFDPPAALLAPASPPSDGGAPGSRAFDPSAVVVVDFTTVELVASTRVVDVVLTLARVELVVALLDVVVVVEEEAERVELVGAGLTTTTPVMPVWSLQ